MLKILKLPKTCAGIFKNNQTLELHSKIPKKCKPKFQEFLKLFCG